MHSQKVIRACQQNLQWSELTFLYLHNDENDNAALTMIDHSTRAWDHSQFKDTMKKVNNHDLYYKGIQFYIEEHPDQLNDLLKSLVQLVDHSRVVPLVRRLDRLALIKPYLHLVQDSNTLAVNEALNELFVEEENFADLRKSIDTYDAFDNIDLAKKLEKHDLMEFRRLAAYLYARNKRWKDSIELSKKDKLYKDAMVTAAQSGDNELAQALLRFFVENKYYECFAACLYTCYDFVAPDVALEIGWSNKILDHTMPYLIQFIKEYTAKVDKLVAAAEPKKPKVRWLTRVRVSLSLTRPTLQDGEEAEGDSFAAADSGFGNTLAITYGNFGQPGGRSTPLRFILDSKTIFCVLFLSLL